MKSWAKKIVAHPFIKNASWMIGGSSLQAGIAFVSNIILARHLMPEDFGTFAIVQANINLSSAILNLKLEPHIIKLTQEELKNQFEVISTVAILQSFLNALIGLLLLMAWGMLNIGGLILLIDKLIAPLVLLQLSMYERKLNYKGISFIETSSNTLSHILAIVLAFGGVGFLVLYIRVFVETGLRLFHLILRRELKKMPVKRVSYMAVKKIIINVRGFWLDALLEGTFERLLILVGGYLLTERQLGYFVQAKRLAITPHQFLQPIAFRISYNFFNKVNDLKAKFVMLQKIIVTEFAVLVVVALVLFIQGDSIIKFLFGEKWMDTVIVLKYMLGVVTFLTLFNTYKSYFMSSHSMMTFFKLGRSIQFAILLSAIGILSFNLVSVNPLDGLSLSYSLSYIVPVLILIGHGVIKNMPFKDKFSYPLFSEKNKSISSSTGNK